MKKVLVSLFASMPEKCLDFIDVARAYFHTKARRRAHVDFAGGGLPRREAQKTQDVCVRCEGCGAKLGTGAH